MIPHALNAEQVRCPSCNAAQRPQGAGNYVCDFCLQPFSVLEAKREEDRLRAEIERWVQEKLGPRLATEGNVDVSSRAFIFQQKVLPELRRDVDRSLEPLAGIGRHALLTSPVAISLGATRSAHPLVRQRRQILELKSLRARLSSERVSSFAMAEDDRRTIEELDGKLAGLLHLSNVAEAAARGDEQGFVSARINLEALLDDLGRQLARSRSPAESAFLAAQQQRFRALAELCRGCEELTSPNAVPGDAIAARLAPIADELDAAATAIEASGHDPLEAVPLRFAAAEEGRICRQIGRWLAAYAALARNGSLSFGAFLREMAALFPQQNAERLGEQVEAVVATVAATRGEAQAPVLEDFTWTAAWAEAGRARKTLGLFGVEEKLEAVEPFLLPVWVAEFLFARAAGGLFTQGTEGRGLAVVDACGGGGVQLFLDGAGPVAEALSRPRPLPSATVALPATHAAESMRMIEAALRSHPDVRNPHVRAPTLGFISAAVAHYQSKNGMRESVAASGGLAAPASARTRIQAFEQLVQRCG